MGRSNAPTRRKLYCSPVLRALLMATGAALAICAVAGLPACSKNSTARPAAWDELGRPAVVEANKQAAGALKAPALFAHIPADTPYVFAGFEPVPGGYWTQVCDQVCPVLQKLLQSEGSDVKDHRGRVISAILGALKGKLSSAGLTELGFAGEARWVLYGLGLQPVLRIEVGDVAVLEATISGIAAAAKVTLEPRSLGAARYRYGLISETVALALGIVEQELVLVWGDPAAVAGSIEQLFAGVAPSSNLGDGAALKRIAADYGFAAYGLGYLDVARLIELQAAADSPSCKAAQAAIGKVVPRVVFGYDQVGGKRLAISAVVETTAVEQLRATQVQVPGFALRIPQGSLLALGLAIDRSGVEAIKSELIPWGMYYRLSCGELPLSLPELVSGGGDADGQGALALLPAELVSETRGGAIVVMSGDTSSAIPQRLAGYGILGVADAKRALASLATLLAQGGLKDAVADARFRTLDLGNLSTFVKTPVGIAGRDGAIVVAAGGTARATIEAGLREPGAGRRPLMVLGLDVGRASRPLHRFFPLPSAIDGGWLEPAVLRSIHAVAEQLLGFAVITASVSGRGLELVARIDLN